MSDLYDDLCNFTAPMWALLRYRLGDLSRYINAEAAEPAVVAQKVVALCNTHPSVQRHVDFVRGAFSRRSDDREGWLAHRHEIEQELRVLGVQAGEGDTYLNLDDLYIELDVVRSGITMREEDECGSSFGRLRADSLQPEEERDQTTLAGALERLAAGRRGHRGLSLTGEPGSGKSTALKKLWCTAYQRWHDDRKEPVPLLLPCATLQHLGIAGLKPRDLRRLADFLSTNDGYHGVGEDLLADPQVPLLVLLDGLDELRRPEDRLSLCRWLAEEVRWWPRALFVLTCRRAAWGAEEQALCVSRLLPFQLLNLTESSVADYVRRWFPRVAESEVRGLSRMRVQKAREQAEHQADELLDTLHAAQGLASDRLRNLTGNPLTLSTLCLVFKRHNFLPRRRGLLYRQCLEVLLRGRPMPGEPIQFSIDDGIKLLMELAWEMQGDAEKVDSPKEVPREQVLRLFGRGRERVETLQREEPEELLRRLRLDCGVLYSAEDVYYQFIHLTFQEYLASEYAAAYNLGARLAERAAEPRWREPILLAMAQPGLSRAFFQQLLRQDIQIHRSILEACFREETPPAEPFVEFLLDEPGPPAADLVLLLSLFRMNAPTLVREAAEKLLEHPDKGVAQLAAEVSGKPLPPRHDGVFVGVVDDPRGFVGTGTARKQVQLGVGSRWKSVELGMEFVWVPPGTFWMGATAEAGKEGFDAEAHENEGPRHQVQISRGFWLGRFLVTNAQVRRFVQESGSESFGSRRMAGFDGAEQPAVALSWHDAQAFCQWAGKLVGHPVTLPTEAEWEYAARGSDGRKYPWGNEKPTLKRAWYGSYGIDKDGNWKKGAGEHPEVEATAAVGGRPDGAGPFGAEEQAGNVWEWCFDSYQDHYAPSSDKGEGGVVLDPGLETLLVVPSSYRDKSDKSGHSSDKRPFRVLRGGAWSVGSWGLRAAYRFWSVSLDLDSSVGFRVVCRVPEL